MRTFCVVALVVYASFASYGAAHRFTVTLNSSGAVAADVPTLLRLPASFNYSDAGDGTHFEIADENGVILPYEIDTWAPGGVSLLWVKVPVFAGGKRLTVTYGRTNEDMTTRAAEVWSNYIGVWHMNGLDSSGKYPNSAGDARFAAEVSSFSRTGQDGRFGQSVLIFTNAMHSLNNVPAAKEKGGVFIPDGGNLNLTNNFTVSGWFNHVAVDNPAIGADGKDQTHAFRFDTLFCKRKHPKANNALNEGSRAGFSLRVNENKSTAGNLVLNDKTDNDNAAILPRSLANGTWQHLALSFDAEGCSATWLNGVCVTNHNVTILDNDEPLVIGNTSVAYLDNEGNRAWGGYADEVRLHRGAPSAAYLAAEYAAMASAHEYGSETCSLTIDKNEHFDDSVTVSSDLPAAADGKYHVGTTITLTAVPNETGTFRKWYGDIPRESWTNATVSFIIERDSWVYARFVHPWMLSADKTTMTDGNFTVYVSVLNEAAHTLTVGKAAEAGLSPTNDTGIGTIDLGGPIRLAGDQTIWTIDRFGGSRGSQAFPASREGPFRYLSPGTVTTTSAHGTQLFHRGDTGNDAPPLFGAPYTMIVLDEPAGSTLICNFMLSNQSELNKLIIQAPNVTDLFRTGDDNTALARIFPSHSLADTRFDWWDLPSLFRIQHGFFVEEWGDDGSLRLRVPARGKLSLPSLRGIDWLAETTYYDGGSPLFLMPNVEEISLGGATEETTVTNLCTYAFAGDSSLRKLTLHAAPDMTVGSRIFADHTHNTFRTNEVVDGVTYSIGSQTSLGRVPDVIRFTGQAVSEAAISNLLADVPVVSADTKPVAIYASKYQAGWRGVGRAEWISTPTARERAAYPDKVLLGVYRAGGRAPSGKAVIIHQGNEWDKETDPGFFIRMR